jgi:hypothetical protein
MTGHLMPIVDMSTAIWHLAQVGNLISVKVADGCGTFFLQGPVPMAHVSAAFLSIKWAARAGARRHS